MKNNYFLLHHNTYMFMKEISQGNVKYLNSITNSFCFNYMVKIKQRLKKKGLISYDKENKVYFLTKKGQEVYKNLTIIFNAIKQDYNSVYESREMKGGLK